MNLEEARRPVLLGSANGNRVAVVAAALPDSGTPVLWAAEGETPGLWAAEGETPGLFLLRRPDGEAEAAIKAAFFSVETGTPRVLSIRWGDNWGYGIPEQHRSFAHRLLDEGIVDLVFGHSSHHPKEVELYRRGAIIYGAGDFINDYEGIGGHREFRPELGVLYRVTFRGRSVRRLEGLPVRRHRLRLELADEEDTRFLCAVLRGGPGGPGDPGCTVGEDGWLRLGGT